jgi:exopolysaccharide biosynthesis polyprenyl glycosylphosphotransferase
MGTSPSVVLPFSERRILLFVGDIICFLFAYFIAYKVQLYLGQQLDQNPMALQGQMLWLFLLLALWLGFSVINETYDLQIANRPSEIVQRLFLSTVEVAIGYVTIFFFIGRPIYVSIPFFGGPLDFGYLPFPPRITAFLVLVTSLFFLILWRLAYTKMLVWLPLRRRALVVGAGWAGRAFVDAMSEASLDYTLVGFIDDDPEKQNQTIQGLPVVGTSSDLLQQVQLINASEIVLAITGEINSNLLQILMSCYEQGIPIRPISLLYEEVLGRVPVEHLGTKWLPTFVWDTLQHPTLFRVFKRLLDVFFGVLGLVVFGGLFPFIALAIYLDSPGPIFYSQERLGRGGRSFWILKFRTMIPNAETGGEARWASRNDNRITRLGKIMRKTRLDELPQVINILKGDMSVVGPRPERPQFVSRLQNDIPFYRTRLSVKPGLTGWAQIKYRYGNTAEDALIKLQYDLYYIKHQSLMLDILIILRTIKVILTFQGT